MRLSMLSKVLSGEGSEKAMSNEMSCNGACSEAEMQNIKEVC